MMALAPVLRQGTVAKLSLDDEGWLSMSHVWYVMKQLNKGLFVFFWDDQYFSESLEWRGRGHQGN
jgi:hypothetical protein